MANTPLNRDTAALIQRGNIQKPGFYGNQEASPSNDKFNTAATIGAQLSGVGAAMKQKGPAPANYVRTSNNYILTTLERQAIENKSRELSTYGVVPYDTLESFFYILAVNENYDDLAYVSDVTGIPDLANETYIRNIYGITQIPDIYKVGYLSQGVSSITNRYGKYSYVQQYEDYGQSSIGNTLLAADLGTALGVVGPSIISTAYNFNGYSGPLSQAPSLRDTDINDSINSYYSIANGTGNALPPTTISAILNPAATVQASTTTVGASVIGKLLGQSPLGGALGVLGPLGGIAIGAILGKTGGNAVGGLMSEILTGQRISTSKRANNPMLTGPSHAGKAYFGEAPVSLPAVDQVFCRRVGSFSTMNGGGGVVSFGMQNYSSFGGVLTLASVVSRMLTGSPEPPPTNTYYGQMIDQHITNMANVMNVQTMANMEMRRSDNAIPFMLGFSAISMGETFSPFGSKPFTEGWKLAASTGNQIQKYNPQYLRAVQSGL